MGSPPLEFINIQPKKGGPPLEFIYQRGGPPLGTISMDPAVYITNDRHQNVALYLFWYSLENSDQETYRKVSGRSTSWLVAHPRIFRKFMSGKLVFFKCEFIQTFAPILRAVQQWQTELNSSFITSLAFASLFSCTTNSFGWSKVI